MPKTVLRRPIRFLLALACLPVLVLFVAAVRPNAADKVSPEQLMKDGNYAEALAAFKLRLNSSSTPPEVVARDLPAAVQCLQRLNQEAEFDGLVEKTVTEHGDKWQPLLSAANVYRSARHYGHLISGEFKRGRHRGGGRMMSCEARDRVRALQLLVQAHEKSVNASGQDRSSICRELANLLLRGRTGQLAWQLQSLTDLEELPDYTDRYVGTSYSQAPVDAEGELVLYSEPKTWEAAASDGERWRWALAQMVEYDASTKYQELNTRAGFLNSQFGVGTLSGMSALLRVQAQDDADTEAKLYLLHTLGEDECLAKVATGVRRFNLSAEFHHILLYQQALEFAKSKDRNNDAASAAASLARIFTDRRQYDRAAEYWREVIELKSSDSATRRAKDSIAQIEKPWGQFGYTVTQPAGSGAEFQFRFRNGDQVEFTAQAIKVADLLGDIKKYLKSEPKRIDWRQLQIEQIGYRIIEEKADKYIGDTVAEWKLDLKPSELHFDREVMVTTPLQKAGAYLVTAKMKDGNTAKCVMWVADTALVKKPLEAATMYYLADAVSGKPVAGANVEFIGYKVDWQRNNQQLVTMRNFAEKSSTDGLVKVDISNKEQSHRFNWLAIARSDDGRLAHLGFHGIWSARLNSKRPKNTHHFAMTDRPVYRPGQKVQMKIWVEQTAYDSSLDESKFAHKQFQLEVRNPKGDVVLDKQVTANAFGGIAAEYELESGATLGNYSYYLKNFGGGSFRVEEYKKPEFEVLVDAPEDPIALGEKFSAKVTARYYFGSPVQQGTLKYKVTRTPKNTSWFPATRWDWLYGEGYWWFTTDANYYPGFERWGCRCPSPWWIWQPTPQPEVVAEGETELAADGTYNIEIDTGVAKALHPNDDHSYAITAEVVDASRRTIVGNGNVIVAREPFQVFAWCDRGYYKTGDTITASFSARRADGKPVAGKGELVLYRVAYPDDLNGEPKETEVRTWTLATDADGQAELQIKASEPGRYRLSYTVTDDGGHKVEGGQLLTIIGEGFDGSEFVFSDLELVPDAKNYAPGEKLKLQINTNRVGSRILLFVRPQDGVYPEPQMVTLDGKSKVVEVPVTAADSPNFFVEALTVAGGDVHVVAKQIAVPPAERIINVAVEPSSDTYKPGEEATVSVKITDEEGKPVVGDAVLTVYDRALEYISGGANTSDIRKSFWGWKRNHNPNTEHNLSLAGSNLTPKNEKAMQWLGRFGYLIDTDKEKGDPKAEFATADAEGAAFGGGGGGRMLRQSGGEMAPTANAVPAMAMDENAAFESDDQSLGAAGGDGGASLVAPEVRSNFVDTAFWGSSIETNAEGIAEITFEMPENTTDWSFKMWGMGHGGRVGDDSASAVTRKDLMIRLQTPRFLIDRDEVVISGIVHNYLETDQEVTVRLEMDGDCLSPLESTQLETKIKVAADGEQRIDWRLKASKAGTAIVRALALTEVESDAMQLEVPVKVHGAPKLIPHSGVIALDAERDAFEVTIPTQRKVEETRLVVQYSPTLAGAMIDALPYLIDYPYGCTEQTLNRFLPAVLTQRTLQKMGVDLKSIREKQVNLNPQELGDADERAAQWKRYKSNPVFDEAELSKVVKTGVERLTEMQLGDGGWGWFSGYRERSSAHTTATVVRGLLIAQQNDLAIVPGVVDRGVEWLVKYQREQLAKLDNYKDGKPVNKDKRWKTHADNLDAFVYLVLAEANKPNDKMRSYLYKDRTKLSPYCLAQFGLALHKQGNSAEQLEMVMRNLSQFVVTDEENQTAYLNLPEGGWWYWYGSEYEAHAYYLKLLAAHDPESDVAAGLVKYLLNNRKHATYWNSTRDTALVVEAMADYLAATGEGKQEMVVEVWLNGQRQQTVEITPDNLFAFNNQFVVEGADLEAGRHTIELRRKGAGRLYYNAYLSMFSLEDDIRAAGLEVKVNRKYYRLTRKESTQETAGGRGQVVQENTEAYDRTEIKNLATVESGDLVEVELTIDSKNDYEYILLEDYKAAGCEPMEVRSGYNGNEMGAYVEYRDDRVALFVRRLARGTHSVSYRLRAEIPGQFSALPTQASAMYAPELRGNSDELKLKIVDAE